LIMLMDTPPLFSFSPKSTLWSYEQQAVTSCYPARGVGRGVRDLGHDGVQRQQRGPGPGQVLHPRRLPGVLPQAPQPGGGAPSHPPAPSPPRAPLIARPHLPPPRAPLLHCSPLLHPASPLTLSLSPTAYQGGGPHTTLSAWYLSTREQTLDVLTLNLIRIT
jgi:hypothetical protein